MSFMREFDHLKIQLEDVLSATNNFSREKLIGRGGFGPVFRGELSLPEGQTMIAFKRLDRKLGQGDVEFWKEILMLSKYKHENLVSLIRFCIKGDEMVLAYEYASRGSLDRYLSDSSLTWIQRLKICVGVARGLCYLHDPKDTQHRVIHRDIKSSNILIDGQGTAKVSDFGLSKDGPANQTRTYVISNPVGTIGYVDPLYSEMGFLTKESDVYSFGVVLFEVLCGRLCLEYYDGLPNILVRKWRKCYEDNEMQEIIFHSLKEKMESGSFKTFSAIAYQCLKRAREERPTMAEVLEQLELAHQQEDPYGEMIRIANHAVPPLSYESPSQLLQLFLKGFHVDDGNTFLSCNKNGEFCEMISATKCVSGANGVFKDFIQTSRFLNGITVTSKHSFVKIEVSTRYLSLNVTYTINIIFKYIGQPPQHTFDFTYKLDNETYFRCVRGIHDRDDGWSTAKLYKFTSKQKEHNFLIYFTGFAENMGNCKYLIEGIEIRPVGVGM